ncbi:MAG: hypothetical protein ACI814_002701 [Mariniblastus sp.]|jgi:hypothetical protein
MAMQTSPMISKTFDFGFAVPDWLITIPPEVVVWLKTKRAFQNSVETWKVLWSKRKLTDRDFNPQRPNTLAIIWAVVKHLAAIFAARFVPLPDLSQPDLS